MSESSKNPCCGHDPRYHEVASQAGPHGCGYLGFNPKQRCGCFLPYGEARDARDAEVAEAARVETLAGFKEWFAPAYLAQTGIVCPLGPETVAREYAQADTDAYPDDEPVFLARRLVGPWEPVEP